MWNAIGSKAQKVAQGMSSAVAEIQQDLQKERRSRGGGSSDVDFDEAEIYKQMLVGFQMDQAKLGKETQAALREKEDEANHWKKLYAQVTGTEDGGGEGAGGGGGGGGDGTPGTGDSGEGAGALGVDTVVSLRSQVDVLTRVNLEWEEKLKEALTKSTEEAASRFRLEHENSALSAKVKELDSARAASEDLILSLSAEKSRMLGSSGEASDTIENLVDEYSRLASEHTAQRKMDSETIQRLENVRDELVEKLKAHETNIMQLLQKAEEEEGAVAQHMSERTVANEPTLTEVVMEVGDATTAVNAAFAAEHDRRLREQLAKFKADNEADLARFRRSCAESEAREKEAALSLAAERHAAAMKRAVKESAAEAEARAAAGLEAALKEADELAGRGLAEAVAEAVAEATKKKEDEREREVRGVAAEMEAEKAEALKEVERKMEEERKRALAKAATAHAASLAAAVQEAEDRLSKDIEEAKARAEETKAELTKQSESALLEQQQRLEAEALEKVAAARKGLEAEVEAAKTARDEANALYAKENRGRKAIHNKLLELQGNIRVLARVRPMLEVELNSGKDADVTSFPAEEDIVIKKPKEGARGREEVTETHFEFDRVFKPDSSQEGVFQAVSPLVTSVLDGYNVCIFAYGQTGSGKTFTMEGPTSNPGVNTRALTDMFSTADARSDDVKYTFHMSMMEIYNEAVYDLLRTDNKDSRQFSSPGGGTKTSLDIRQNATGGTSVPGLTEVVVAGMSEVKTQLERGGKNRAVGAHDMNEHSSRSHMIFNVRAEGTNVHTGTVVKAKLNLIDLAGSERISKTDATGDRLREAQNINRSLSALGDVIAALGAGKGHVPFRNSKLTFVLQDALSGKSKVMMFVNVSPASYNVTETLCSLNFAKRCRSVKLGQAAKNQEAPEVAKYRRACEALQAQLLANDLVPTVTIGAGAPASSSSSASSSASSSMRRKSLGNISTGSGGGGGGVGRGGDALSSASSSRASSPKSSTGSTAK
ncbi:unnamed protein product [Pylaiella littoralis]